MFKGLLTYKKFMLIAAFTQVQVKTLNWHHGYVNEQFTVLTFYQAKKAS